MADPERVPHAMAIGLLLVIVVPAVVILFLRDLLRRRAERRSGVELARDRARVKTPAWHWALILVAIVAGFFKSGAVLLVGLFTLALGAYAYAYFSGREDRAFVRRANDGDLEGVIADLRGRIEVRGPSARRSSLLGCLLMKQERWQEAYKSFLDAEERGDRSAASLSNRGVVLLRMGHVPDAASVLEEACSMAPMDAVPRLNLCSALIALGRREEAAEHLTRAETQLKKSLTFVARPWRRAVAQLMEDCRKGLSMPTEGEETF